MFFSGQTRQTVKRTFTRLFSICFTLCYLFSATMLTEAQTALPGNLLNPFAETTTKASITVSLYRLVPNKDQVKQTAAQDPTAAKKQAATNVQTKLETAKAKLTAPVTTPAKTSSQVPVSNYQIEDLELKANNIAFLNFTATASAVLKKDANAASLQTAATELQDDLVTVKVPSNLLLEKSSEHLQVAKELKANQLQFTANQPENWLINLQLKNYSLAKVNYNPESKHLDLYYRELKNLPGTTRLAYYSGLFNNSLSFGNDKKTLESELPNLATILQAAQVDYSKGIGLTDLLTGEQYTPNKAEIQSKYALLGLTQKVPSSEQTISQTLIIDGQATQAINLCSLASQTSASIYSSYVPKNRVKRDTTTKLDGQAQTNDKTTNSSEKESKIPSLAELNAKKISPAEYAKLNTVNNQTQTALANTQTSGQAATTNSKYKTIVKTDATQVAPTTTLGNTTSTKLLPNQKVVTNHLINNLVTPTQVEKATSQLHPAMKLINKGFQPASKYNTVVSPSETKNLIPVTGETVGSIGLALACFALAILLYSLKQKYQA